MKHHLRFIFLGSFFFSLHMALLAYANSSMLGQFASHTLVSITYTTASILSLFLVAVAPQIVRRIGVLRTILVTLCASTILLYLISRHEGISIIPYFILYFSLNSVALYTLDLLLEHYTTQSKTGNIRGLYLTLSNIGWVVAPLLSGSLEERFGFPILYIIAAFAVALTVISIYGGQRGFVDKAYKESRLSDGLRVLRKSKNIRILTGLNFLLQLFFVVMVIYSPVYLTTVLGFSWKMLGIILSIMLLPFVLFPYPAGRLADRYLGEKELMCGALLLMGLATAYFAQLGHASLAIYAGVLFVTRAGASVLEVMCDSAFFKQVSDADSSVISIYRNMMPVAYTIGPLVAAIAFTFLSYKGLFTALGGVMLLSIFLALQIKDSR